MASVATVLGLALFGVGCADGEPASRPPQSEKLAESEDTPPSEHTGGEVLATDLNVPWDMMKRGETFFISERPGHIITVTANGQMKNEPLHLEKDVVQNGEGGLLGFVLAPDDESSKTAYIYHTYRQNGNSSNRIVKIKRTDGGWVEQSELLDDIPGAAIHNGGRLEIGPDGNLYATTGDASRPENAQNLDSLSGKILRMNPDGSIPGDNPFPDSYVYSYGHRNPQGMAWSEDGNMYSAEHGSSAHDEVNHIKPGGNYGWPVIQGDETKDGMISPLFHSGENTWAPSGLAYHDGKLYVVGLRGMQIRAFHLKDRTSEIVYEGAGRLRDMMIENGTTYVITNNTDGRGNPGPDDDRLLKLQLADLN